MEKGRATQPASVLEAARCPRCGAPVDLAPADGAVRCSGCGRAYPRLGDVPVLLPEADLYLASCRRQLTLLEAQAGEAVRAFEQQLDDPHLLPLTRTRLRGMIEATRAQLADVRALIGPLLPAEAPPGGDAAPPVQAPAALDYRHYLYRDWGRPRKDDGENERTLAAVEGVLEGAPPGRTLVLGAGAGRLPYELSRRHPDAEMVLVDVDPVLVAAARAVTRGERLSVREANLEMGELAQGSRRWTLSAPHGAVPPERFHFLIADGTAPPFAAGTFDTVLTPWFLDQGPADVRDFMGTVYRLLRPGGRWVNVGPLLYAEAVPLGLRFGREELFDLAARAGFRVGRWQTESAPYLVSELNGRGRVEWVLAFAAARLDGPPQAPGDEAGPPSWLLFPHLPIPTFAGQALFRSEAPAVQMVVSSIDGRRTMDDIAVRVARQAQRPDVSLHDIRGAVRQLLAEVHPACRGETGARPGPPESVGRRQNPLRPQPPGS